MPLLCQAAERIALILAYHQTIVPRTVVYDV